MKAMKTILAMMAVAGLAMAQTPAASKPKAPASQTVTGTAAAAPAKAPAKKPAAAAPAAKAAKAPAKPAAKTTAKKAVVTAVAKPAAPAKPAAKGGAGKRDPFVNPVVRVAAGGGGGSMCSTGKRCLMINDMMLRGIVKTSNGMIAVVSNSANRAYFLKENDPVFNGTVVRITSDSVVFRESVVDNMGRESTREVVKRVNAPTV